MRPFSLMPFDLISGAGHLPLPSCSGGAAETDPVLHNVHDLGAQTSEVPTPALWQVEGDL